MDRNLNIVQCSANAVELLPPEQVRIILSHWKSKQESINEDEQDDFDFDSTEGKDFFKFANDENQNREDAKKRKAALDFMIGKPLGLIFGAEHVSQVKDVIENVIMTSGGGGGSASSSGERHSLPSFIQPPSKRRVSDDNFLLRSESTLSLSGRISCSVLPSSQNFLLELEKTPLLEKYAQFEDRDVMSFMEEIAKELRACWSIEEMASLVCAKVMQETPYDRGMVYKFDHEDCGEVVYEAFRSDASEACRKDSFLGLRFPASDIPRQARELFMRNTLRVVYDVDGNDFELYPPMVDIKRASGEKELGYTDLSMCRLRGSSFVHLKYLKNMGVTSTMVIAIIVNGRLWGLYSFHGYREPLVPSARTRFLCEMASITTSIIMESLTRKESNERLMSLDSLMNSLQTTSLSNFVETNLSDIMGALQVNLISFRVRDPPATPEIKTFLDDTDGKMESPDEITNEVFDSLVETYGSVCRDYGVVYIDDQKSNTLLVNRGIHTLVFFRTSGVDVILSRNRTIERVTWGGGES